jgi:hypothetical protein
MSNIDRQFIRHPSAIPLEYCITSAPARCNMDMINNVSQGGLSFHSSNYIKPKQWLHLYIPLDEHYFETDAQVRWCKPVHQKNKMAADNSHKTHYDVGVSFCNNKEAFSARMVEQVCYIEEYKKNIKKKEGRELSSDQAAAEWIAKYADRFPSLTQ